MKKILIVKSKQFHDMDKFSQYCDFIVQPDDMIYYYFKSDDMIEEYVKDRYISLTFDRYDMEHNEMPQLDNICGFIDACVIFNDQSDPEIEELADRIHGLGKSYIEYTFSVKTPLQKFKTKTKWGIRCTKNFLKSMSSKVK